MTFRDFPKESGGSGWKPSTRSCAPELRALTHEMVAYQNAWERRGNQSSVQMTFEDFFEAAAHGLSQFQDCVE
jgi:hypothetical protein